MTKAEFEARLKEARVKNRKRKLAGEARPNPTKKWSRKSAKSLTRALSVQRKVDSAAKEPINV